jgi:tetratricopeptide (TPR) repeat protein
LRQAGAIACLLLCAACAQVALMSVSPVIAALATHFDRQTAGEMTELEKKQDWPGMLRLARTQLQLDPRRSETWFLQGYALARQGKHAEAIESYEQALRISPEYEDARLYMGESQRASGQTERAIQTYRQMLRDRPESSLAYLALGDIYQGQGKLDLAITNYRECVRYDPEAAQAWYGLALAYHRGGQNERRDEALQGLRRLHAPAADQFERQYLSK